MSRRTTALAAAALATAWAMAGCGPGEQGGERGESAAAAPKFTLSSTVFENGGQIPAKYGYAGGDASPPLTWSGVPTGAVELALTVTDADAAGRTHWLVYGIPPAAFELPERRPKDQVRLAEPEGALQGTNSFGGIGWGGPDPPGGEVHHYVFELHALRERLNAEGGLTREQFDAAMVGKVLATATLTGTFEQ